MESCYKDLHKVRQQVSECYDIASTRGIILLTCDLFVTFIFILVPLVKQSESIIERDERLVAGNPSG